MPSDIVKTSQNVTFHLKTFIHLREIRYKSGFPPHGEKSNTVINFLFLQS